MLRILGIPKRRTKGHELSRWSEQPCNGRVLAFSRHQDVFTFGNLAALVAIDWFVKIKPEAILDVPPGLKHGDWPKLGRNMLLLDLLDVGGYLTTRICLTQNPSRVMQQEEHSECDGNDRRPQEHSMAAPPDQEKDEAEYCCANRAGIRECIGWRNRSRIEHKVRNQQNGDGK